MRFEKDIYHISCAPVFTSMHQHACISLHQHASACISMRQYASACISMHQYAQVCISMHQHAYVSMHQHASACVCMHQHASVVYNLYTICISVLTLSLAHPFQLKLKTPSLIFKSYPLINYVFQLDLFVSGSRDGQLLVWD